MLMVSLGGEKELSTSSIRKAGIAVAKWLVSHEIITAGLRTANFDNLDIEEGLGAFCQGLLIGAFQFDRYKSKDNGANPVEHLLNALAGCVTTSMVAHAAVLGIHIEELESELEGDIDLNGFLGLDSGVPKGFTDIRVKFKVKTAPENLEKLRQLVTFSPVYNTLIHSPNVDIQVDGI